MWLLTTFDQPSYSLAIKQQANRVCDQGPQAYLVEFRGLHGESHATPLQLTMDACASMSRSSWFLRDLRQFMSPCFISDPFRGFLSCPSQSRICKLSPISSNSTPMVMHIYLAKNLSTRTSSQLPSQVPNMRKYGQSPTVFNHDAPNRTHGSSSSKKNG
jgi:hypothetical protein